MPVEEVFLPVVTKCGDCEYWVQS